MMINDHSIQGFILTDKYSRQDQKIDNYKSY
jgi:hypothetical protein